MKVLFLTQSVRAGHPVLAFTRGWICALARRVSEVTVLAREGGEPFAEGNVHVHATGGGWLRRGRGAWLLLRALREEPDVVFAHMVPRWAHAARRWARSRRPVVVLWYAHGTLDPWLARCGPELDRIYTPDAISCPLATPNVRAFGHGIDLAERVPRRESVSGQPPRLLVAGRIAERKRTAFALAVHERLSRDRPGLGLSFAGSPLTARDRALARTLRARTDGNPSVHWLGAVPHAEMRSLLAQCDLLLHPSSTGSLDKVVLEAWSVGTPVVARADVHGAWMGEIDPEALPRGEDAGDWADSARAILALDAREAERRAGKRREFVERGHSLPLLMDAIVRDLRQLVQGAGTR